MPSAPTNMQDTVSGTPWPWRTAGQDVIAESLSQQEAAEPGRGPEGPAWVSAVPPLSAVHRGLPALSWPQGLWL